MCWINLAFHLERSVAGKGIEVFLNIIRLKFQDEAERVDELDGVSMEFKHWRYNVRKSNTEPLVRLNVETRGDKELLSEKVQELIALIRAS